MPPPAVPRFEPFTAQHLGPVLVTAAGALLAVVAVRRWPHSRGVAVMRHALAAALLINLAVWQVGKMMRGTWEADDSLPLHLCHAAGFAAFLALVRPRPLACELTYFWGLGGTLQALLTPAVQRGYPDPMYFQFFLHHGGVVVAAALLVFGLGHIPRRGSPWRMLLATNLLAAAAGAANHFTGGNYMFLSRLPPNASLLDYMGPWPWYILTGEGLALGLFILLDLPFRRRRRAGERVVPQPR